MEDGGLATSRGGRIDDSGVERQDWWKHVAVCVTVHHICIRSDASWSE